MGLKPINKRLTAKIDDTKDGKEKDALIRLHEPSDLVFKVIAASDNEQGIKAGDRILVSSYHAVEKEVLGEMLYIIHADSVYGILT